MTAELAWLAAGPSAEPRLLAEIHATVELERALRSRGQPPDRAAHAVDDALLGARVVVLPDGIAIAEPSTEGRLAASLARHDEGIVGRYVEAPVRLDVVARLAAAAGVALSRPADGPLGRQVLVLGGPIGGPHVVLVERRTVPSPG